MRRKQLIASSGQGISLCGILVGSYMIGAGAFFVVVSLVSLVGFVLYERKVGR